jgi:hypothetical protein
MRSPRVAGTCALVPNPLVIRVPEYRSDDTLDSTMENPVYVNNASVVEVRALFKPDERESEQANDKPYRARTESRFGFATSTALKTLACDM